MARKPEGSRSESHCTLSKLYEANPAGCESGIMQTGLGQSNCDANRAVAEKLREGGVNVDSRNTLHGHNKHCCVQ